MTQFRCNDVDLVPRSSSGVFEIWSFHKTIGKPTSIMSPLPKLDPALENELNPDYIRAYEICLQYEGELASEDKVRQIRILGFLLLYATNDGVRAYLAESILSCNNDPEILVNLGWFFEQNVILPCE